ncbi:MAG TPA: carboxypeptidase M32 [Methanocella sp.]
MLRLRDRGMAMEQERREFLDMVRELNTLGQVAGILGWDEQTYMPPGSARNRARQNAALASVIHSYITSERMGRLIRSLTKQELPPDCAVILRETERDWRRANSIPEKLIKEINSIEALSFEAWAEARRKNNFRVFEPLLARTIDLKMQVAEHVGYEDKPYDALLDEYEPGMKASDVDALFAKLRIRLLPVAKKIMSLAEPVHAVPAGTYPPDDQRKLITMISTAMGFDLNYGRIDVSPHPFTIGIGRDVRITVRYDESNPIAVLIGGIHETGHALYEQGFDEKYEGTPLAEAVSTGVHESQSKIWEYMVGRSLPFWTHFYPKMQDIFPVFRQAPLDAWYREINDVRPTINRVNADEVTYNLHIMIRYDVESALFDGRLKPEEIPAFWDERYKHYLGLEVPEDASGCLQDMHWAIGMFGYFPTYTLGILYAAQLWDAARRQVPDLEGRIATGDLGTLLGWLRENVHRHGRRYDARELIKKATGRAPGEECFIRYLHEKYGRIYGISL